MRTKIFFITVLFGVLSLTQSQSNITYDAGTNLDIQTGADVCTETLIMYGTFTGNGTVCGQPIGITQISTGIPKTFELYTNYPNPFNPDTKIQFSIPKSSNLKLDIYDAAGRIIAILVNEDLNPGKYEVDWDASHQASGVYFYRMVASEQSSGKIYTAVKKMLLVK